MPLIHLPARAAGMGAALCALATVAGFAAPPDDRPSAATAGHLRMIEMLREIADNPPEDHFAFPAKKVAALRETLAARMKDGPPADTAATLDLWQIVFDLGQAEVRLGETRPGIEHLEQACSLLTDRGATGKGALRVTDPAIAEQIAFDLLETRFQLGVANMWLGEDQNCCARESGEACILPLRGGGLHRQKEGSRQAARWFQEVVESPLPDEKVARIASAMIATGRLNIPLAVRYHESARWLLNIAWMTLGGYPDQVPERWRLPAATFTSKIPFPRFENIMPRMGLDTFGLSGGAIADDFDNDGNLDIVTSDWDLRGQTKYFHSNGNGTFEDLTVEANLTGLFGGLNMVQADWDNDGDVDIYVTRGSWLYQYGRHPNSLLNNNGDGTFSDVTFEVGLGLVHYPTKTASWADYDNDGDLDLFVANESSAALKAPTQLFRNNGDGTFIDVAPWAAAQGHCFGMGTVWGDYDNDRFPDLYISGCSPAALLHNNRDGTFTNVAKELNVPGPSPSFPMWWWDFDNDGALDLFVGATSGSVGYLALNPLGVDVASSNASQLELQKTMKPGIMHLYRNDGRNGFREVAGEMGLVLPAQPMGANFGDLDNDGWLDFHLGTGDIFYSELTPNLMFLNRQGKGFDDVTMAGGFGHLQKGHGVSFSDLDNDGDQDVFVEIGGAFPGDKFFDALYENPGFGNHWITVRLDGRRSNRAAIGARIRARILEDGRERSIYRHVNSGGSFGCNPLRQTIGLGRAERLLSLEIWWPTTDVTQRFENVPMDQAIRIVEDADRWEPMALERFRLGGGALPR